MLTWTTAAPAPFPAHARPPGEIHHADIMLPWTPAAPAVSAAFLSSVVEVVEAFTIVLAVATVRGWRPAALGAIAGLALLALIVIVFGPLLGFVPLWLLQLTIGILLLLFGIRWLRKAI